eukprot:Skav209700  [mRNA]  locus=scaffold36:131769:134431:+ [translate_table: standard]
MADGMLRSPTFLVGADTGTAWDDPGGAKVKAQKGHNDADACLTAPLVLGVADGVSQIEECHAAMATMNRESYTDRQ